MNGVIAVAANLDFSKLDRETDLTPVGPERTHVSLLGLNLKH